MKLKQPVVIQITTVDVTLHAFRDILTYLRDQGFAVTGVCAPGRCVEDVEKLGIEVLPAPMTRRITPFSDLIAFLRLVRLLFKRRPLIVQTHTPKANLLGQWAAWLARVPIRICTVHGLYFTPSTPQPRRWIFQWMERLTALPATAVWLINNDDVKTATSKRICAPAKIRLLDGGFGIDLDKFDPDRFPAEVRRQTRQELGWTAEHCVIGFVGRLVREKGLLELLAAVAAVRQHVPNLRLMIVGPIDHAKRDAVDPQVAEQYGVGDICQFTGLCTDMARMYCAMDVFVLPSHREGLPLSSMEAQAMGLPVITTDARGCRESVAPEVSGFVVPVKNSPALGAAIRVLATDADLRQRMGAAARELAKRRFDRRRACRFHEEEYRQLMNNLVKQHTLPD